MIAQNKNNLFKQLFNRKSMWFYQDEISLDETLILGLLVLNNELKIDDIPQILKLVYQTEKFDSAKIESSIENLLTSNKVVCADSILSFNCDTYFHAVWGITKKAEHPLILKLLSPIHLDNNSRLQFINFCINDDIDALKDNNLYVEGCLNFVTSQLFWDQEIKKDPLNMIASLMPNWIVSALAVEDFKIIHFLLSAPVQTKIANLNKSVNYDFSADKWLVASDDEAALFTYPISADYLTYRKQFFKAAPPLFSYTTVLDILIRKVWDFNQLPNLVNEYNNIKKKMNFQYSPDLLSTMDMMVCADKADLMSMCEDIHFVRNLVVDGDLENDAEYYLLLIFLIAIYPLQDTNVLKSFKKKLINEPYIQKILQQTLLNPFYDVIKRLTYDLFGIEENHIPFFKPLTAGDIFIGQLGKILNSDIFAVDTVSDKRLVWLLDEKLGLSAKIQKTTKQGWSSGQSKSGREIEYEIRVQNLSTTLQDRLILTAIKNYDSNIFNYSNLPCPVNKAILNALNNAPNIIDIDNRNIAIIPKKRLVVAKRTHEKYTFDIYPKEISALNTLSNRSVELYEMMPGIYAYEDLDNITKDALDFMTKAPKVSQQEKDQILTLLDGKIDFYDDEINQGTVRCIPTNTKLHLWLKMQGNVLQFQITLHDEKHDITFASYNTDEWVEHKNQVWCKRNIKEEKQLIRNLLQTFGLDESFDTKTNLEFQLDENPQLLEQLGALTDVTIHWHNTGNKVRIFSEKDFKLSIKSDNDWFKVSAEVSIDGVAFLEIQKLFEAKRTGFITVDNEKIQVILTKALKERINLLEGVLNEDFAIEAKLAYPLQQLINLMQVESDETWQQLSQKWNQPVDIPQSLLAPLRDYQKTSVKWAIQMLENGFGICLADDMGLGKTIQSLKVIEHFADKGPSLVIAPKSVLFNWAQEATQFTHGINPILFDNTDSKQDIFTKLNSNDLLIMGYSQVSIWEDELININWQTVVLDEAQNIKNHTTQRAKTIFKLNVEGKLVLSGTPIENHLLELWSLFSFINPGLLGSLESFKKKYGAAHKDEGDLVRLRAIASPFIMRRLKKEVLSELPDKIEINHHISLNESEMTMYEVVRQNAVNNLSNNPIELLSALTRLRQICCDPYLVFNDKTAISSKLQTALDLISEGIENGHKILIFSQFVGLLTRLGHFLTKSGLPYSLLTGQTSLDQRAKEIDNFKQNKTDAFLISLKAGGTGLNLTEADMVIHLDPWWNPAVEDQASDRAHRIGQTEVVTIYRLIAEKTIEEKIIALHEKKRDLAEKVLSGQDVVQTINPALLLSLLRDEE